MNRKIVLALIAILLAVAVSAILWSMRDKAVATGPALPTFDYASADSWAERPELPPPAVWETGWDIDIVLLAGEAALEISDTQAIEKRRDEAAEKLHDLAGAFSKTGPVYAPYLRAATVDEDTAAALTHYLSTDNRGRAFLIATDRPLPASVLPLFESDPLLRDRFGGILLFGEANSGTGLAEGVTPALICSRRYKADEGCVAPVQLRRSGSGHQASGGERLVNGLIPWLNDNTSKLAEPLGELEEIEIIEIRRPGETDDVVSESQD
ncbi:hypothetical protein [Hyphomonas sp.]|jgi:hypothetical protein|uniref:hypothetical protein n=1 Tax=Hyphomonas sp. TaxID=87 RepID=UPI0025B8329F|nr:hypothetical protein [Hyphomonas sp.]